MDNKIDMSPELSQFMYDQLAAFRAKFGRDPEPDDPVLFDPDADTPTALPPDRQRQMAIDAAKRVGMDPQQLLSLLRINEG